ARPAAQLRKSVETPAAAEKTPETSPAAAEPVKSDEFTKPAPTIEAPKPAPPPRTKAADQPVKRNGQVAVFVSRKEKKIFVRQGFVPIFDMPVIIEEPDRPLGTHVFTAIAMTDDGAGMRWNLMTVPNDLTAHIEQREGRRK